MNASNFQPLLRILLLLAFLAACAPAQNTQLPTATPTLTPEPTLQLRPCGGAKLCGTLQVYENRAAKSGRMISLNILVIKALSDHPAPDPIFYLAGGPGGSAVEDARTDPIPSSLHTDRDLVFVDQRGTGGSNRVLVPPDLQLDVSGLSPEEFDNIANAYVADYLATVDMDPRYYTTSIAMDDLDEVRQALGYDKINLVGYSYGATAAQYYLRQHEEHVRSVTLGVGSLLDIPVFQREAYTSQLVVDRIFDLCLADPACKAAFPEIKKEFTGLMDSLSTQPAMSTYTDPVTLQPAPVIFTTNYLGGLIRALIKNAERDPSFPLFIHRAYQDDDWQGFTDYMNQGGGPEWWGPQIMERVIRCDEKWAAFDPAVVAQISQGSFLAAYSVDLAQKQAVSCKYTPDGVTPEGMEPQVGSQVPVLLWNGNLDPLNPPENVTGAQELWPNSITLVSPYQSHNINGSSKYCFMSIMGEFIQTGSVVGLETSCLQGLRPPTFATP